ncbi:MAG TPA: RDD family protein [Mycobacteriales bacterium]|nr:RDD family protein [Mycobacteriales bacterium]
MTTYPPPRPPSADPSQPRHVGAPFASWGRRVVGYLIDAVGVAVIAWVIGLIVGGIVVRAAIGLILVLVLGWMNGASGRTPGKRVVRIRVVRDADGQVLGGGLGVVRTLCHFLDTVACLLGWLWPLWDAKNQTFADKIVASVVLSA